MRLPRLRNRKAKVVTAFLCGVALVAGGISYAYISGSGTGSAEKVAGTPNTQPLVLKAVFSPSPALVPGTSVAFKVNADNPNAQKSKVNAWSVAGPITVTPTTGNTCAAEDFSVTGITQTPNLLAPTSTNTNVGTGTLALADSDVNEQSGCAGATVHIPLQAS